MTRATKLGKDGKDGKPAIPESALLANVIKAARLTGWRSAHFRPAMTRRGRWVTPVQGDGKGWPDLVLVKNGRIWFIELKSQHGKVTPEQSAWLDELSKVESPFVRAFVVRPSQFADLFDAMKRI